MKLNECIDWGFKKLESLTPVALLLARVSVGVVFIGTGWGKLHNISGVTEYFQSLGIVYPHINAWMVAFTEFVGGLLLFVGLATRFVALALIGVMAVAIATAFWPDVQHLSDLLGLHEWTYSVVFFVLAVFGAGSLSIDKWISELYSKR